MSLNDSQYCRVILGPTSQLRLTFTSLLELTKIHQVPTMGFWLWHFVSNQSGEESGGQWDSHWDILWAINLVKNREILNRSVYQDGEKERFIPSPSISVHHSGAWFQNVLPLYMGYTPTQQLTGYTPTQQLKPVYPDLSKQWKTHLFLHHMY